MRKKSVLAVALVASMCLGMLAGCGGGEKKAETTADGKVVLELFSTKTESKETVQGLVDKFNESQDKIEVQLTQPADAGTVLKTRMTKDDLPDIVAMGGDSTYTELQSAGVLVDLSDADFVANINESYMDILYMLNMDMEEKAYGIPYATNSSGIIYNKDIFEENGIEIPTTFTELLEVCETLKAAGVTPFELTFKDAWTILPAWNSMAPVLQPENFYADRKAGETTFYGTHEELLEKYLQLIPYAQADYMGTSYDDGNKNFAAGSAAMMINGNWAITEIKKANADINIDQFKFPASDDADANLITSGIDVLLGVTTACADQEAAKEFIAFMCEQENAQQYIDEQFAFSAVTGVEQSDPTVAGVIDDIAAGKVADYPDHFYVSGLDLSADLSQFFLDLNNGKDNAQNIEDTLKKIDSDYDALNL